MSPITLRFVPRSSPDVARPPPVHRNHRATTTTTTTERWGRGRRRRRPCGRKSRTLPVPAAHTTPTTVVAGAARLPSSSWPATTNKSVKVMGGGLYGVVRQFSAHHALPLGAIACQGIMAAMAVSLAYRVFTGLARAWVWKRRRRWIRGGWRRHPRRRRRRRRRRSDGGWCAAS